MSKMMISSRNVEFNKIVCDYPHNENFGLFLLKEIHTAD